MAASCAAYNSMMIARFWCLPQEELPGRRPPDLLTFVRSHWWSVSEGFSLSTANPDVRKLPVYAA